MLKTVSNIPNPKRVIRKRIYNENRTSLKKREIKIKTEEDLKKLFDWMEKVFKSLGFYKFKRRANNDDQRLSFLLGISQNSCKNYRLRNGQIPRQKVINRIKELEFNFQNSNVYITKLNIKKKGTKK